MDFTTLVRRRRMVRSYQPDVPVPRAQLDALLELAVRAPSAGNTQGWQFLVLDTEPARTAFWAATADTGDTVDTGDTADGAHTGDPWLARMRTAPALILCLSDKSAYLDRYAEPDKGWTDRDEARWPVPYWDIDTGMAALLILLGAVDAGLGACFFGVPPHRWDAVRAALSIPPRLRAVGVISVGAPAADRRSPSLARGRRPWASVVHYNSFGSDSAPEAGSDAPPSG